MKKILLFMLPLVALSLASCEKDNGNGEELSGDDIIQFEDPNFLKALLTVQEIEIYDAERDDWVDYMVDVDRNKDGQISVNEAQQVKGLDLYNHETGEGTGFSFYDYNAETMLHTIDHAITIYYDFPEQWENLIEQAMKENNSWENAAQAYIDQYMNLTH